jgi:hypothetical protein
MLDVDANASLCFALGSKKSEKIEALRAVLRPKNIGI